MDTKLQMPEGGETVDFDLLAETTERTIREFVKVLRGFAESPEAWNRCLSIALARAVAGDESAGNGGKKKWKALNS